MNHSKYFKQYRSELGYTNQEKVKSFLSGKDIIPSIDHDYIIKLNNRIKDIITKINNIIHQEERRKSLNHFFRNYIDEPYQKIKQANIISKMNNQGRRPEEVLFSWLRGYVITEFFIPSISKIFNTEINSITNIGDDDLKNIDLFKRSPKADLEIEKGGRTIRIEVQSGFKGANDIKEHKIREAKRVKEDNGVGTLCIHFDFYNGQVGFIQLDQIKENDINFVTRQQMEGQSVLTIDQNYFKWRLLEQMPKLEEIEVTW